MENICDDHQIGILPQDVLIHQILVLLPVISLLRFKSVCKSWCYLIQSSFFIDLHLNTTTSYNNNNNNFGTFIIQTSELYVIGDTRESEAFMLSASGSGSGSGEEEEPKWEDSRFPSCYKVIRGCCDYIFMVGSCNGLVCIHDTKERVVSLWNPATRQFRLLPKSLTTLEVAGVPVGKLAQDFVAFGYDVKTKDYKVVQISHFRPYMIPNNRWLSVKEYILRVQVYSLSSDSWRLLEGIDFLPALPIREMGAANHGVYLNGSYYFLGWNCTAYEIKMTRDTRILSFDFTKEIFTTIQHPLPHDHYPRMMSTYLGEKLAVFVHLVDEEDRSDFETYEIWVLNEHGGAGMKIDSDSWTKLHALYTDGKPRGMSNNGEFVFIGNGRCNEINDVFEHNLELFNLVTQQIKYKFPTPHEVVRVYVCNQSLVSTQQCDLYSIKNPF